MAIGITGSYSSYAYAALQAETGRHADCGTRHPAAGNRKQQAADIPASYTNGNGRKHLSDDTENRTDRNWQENTADSIQKNTEKAAQEKTLGKYAADLAKLVPSVIFKIGTGFSQGAGKTVTLNPGLLVKMKHDPQQAKDTMEMLKGVEFITRSMDSLYKATGKKLVYRHSYIDSDGKYRAVSRVIDERGLKMSAAMRKERQQNSAKLIRKTKENAAKRKKDFQKKTAAKRLQKAGRTGTAARNTAGAVLDIRL